MDIFEEGSGLEMASAMKLALEANMHMRGRRISDELERTMDRLRPDFRNSGIEASMLAHVDDRIALLKKAEAPLTTVTIAQGRAAGETRPVPDTAGANPSGILSDERLSRARSALAELKSAIVSANLKAILKANEEMSRAMAGLMGRISGGDDSCVQAFLDL